MADNKQVGWALAFLVVALLFLFGNGTQASINPFKDPNAYFQSLSGTTLNIVLGFIIASAVLLVIALFFKDK